MENENILTLQAINGRRLTAEERAKLSADSLAQLAIYGHIELTREERDRIPECLLSILVVQRNTRIDPDEIKRFSPTLRGMVENSLKEA